MGWIIRKETETRFLIVDDGMAKGDLTFDGVQWKVQMMMVDALGFRNGSLDQCIGYVRGIEATVNLYANDEEREL